MDAKDILGLPKTPFSVAQERRPRPQKDSQRKPDGVSREVYALTGGMAPLMPTIEPSHLKRRPNSEKEKITWQWLPFTSSARADNLHLYHWVRVVNGTPPTGDYSFAKYNKSVDVLKYTDAEYEKHLTDPLLAKTCGKLFSAFGMKLFPKTLPLEAQSYTTLLSPEGFAFVIRRFLGVLRMPCYRLWTKEETDQLFDLCERFDLRFIVIADRFPSSRSVEELKSRYYAVTRELLVARAPSSGDVSGHPLVKEPYNAPHEIERKRALSAFLSQTKLQERKDAEILAEAKRILETRMISKGSEDVELPVSPAVTETTEKVSVPTDSVSPSSNNRPTSLPSAPPTATIESASTPASLRMLRVFLRTHALGQMVQAASSTSGIRTIKRVDQTLQDLGVHVKPKVPTKAVCAEHLELRKEIITLLNLQKQLQNKEAEASANHDNSYTETPGTPKRSNRGDLDRPFIPDSAGFTGERVGKRDHKRKVPGRFTDAPPSPPQSKRPRKS